MNRRELFKGISAGAFVAGFAGVAEATTIAPIKGPLPSVSGTPIGPREVLSLNKGWRFHDGDIPFPTLIDHNQTYNAAKAGRALGAAASDFEEGEDWVPVTLPHDFVSFQPIVPDGNVDQGYRKRGIVWYRNTLRFEERDHGKHLELQLDGIATFATVWFNGTLVERNWSGYNSSYIDLTPYATYGNMLNSLVVCVDAKAMEGWWYEGGGIYRDVRIVKRSPVHIVTDGVFAHPVKDAAGWHIPAEVTVNNTGGDSRTFEVTCDLLDQDGSVICFGKKTSTVPALQDAVVTFDIQVPVQPQLWTTDTPILYSVRTRLYAGANPVDEIITTCGFRTQRYDAQKGFFLNDKPLKIKGVCLHQDHAGVGTAVPEGIIDYRLRRLKEIGCNAIRFSHNAQSTALMDACDRHGFLVMAENRNFNASPDYLAQLEWLVRRDRNHPCVYMWSVFNEEPMQGTEQGYEMVRRMSAVVKSLDTSRPVTAAMNGGLFTPLNVAHAVDVVGINYQQNQYDAFHKAHPTIPLYSSEDTSAFMSRGVYKTDKEKHVCASYDDDAAPWGETHRAAWKAVHEREFVAGTFVWTGFDYHGEPTPYTWPSNSSLFGIMDLCGFAKAAFYIHQAQWVDDKPVLGLVPHWNWQAGDMVRVMACSNLETVELFVNGKSAGKQPVDRYEMNYWNVPFAPGFIEVRGYKGGKLVTKTRNETTGPAVALMLETDRGTLTGDGCDAMPITVMAVDAKGRVVPTANHMVTFGGSADIIGLGNGDANCLEPEKGNQRSLYNGLAQVIVQAKDIGSDPTGLINLVARAEGLKPVNVEIWLNPPAAPIAYQATESSVQILDSWFMAPVSATRPDPNQKAGDSDMNSWTWFRPGELLPSLSKPGYVLTAVTFMPYQRVQKKGGTCVFLNITGMCEVFVDGVLAGTKSDAAPAALEVKMPAKSGDRRISVLFSPKAGEPFGFNGVVNVKA